MAKAFNENNINIRVQTSLLPKLKSVGVELSEYSELVMHTHKIHPKHCIVWDLTQNIAWMVENQRYQYVDMSQAELEELMLIPSPKARVAYYMST